MLKLCLVFAMLAVGPLLACGASALQTADTWAQRVCQLVNALPEAASSSLPTNIAVTVQITPTVAVAVIASFPPPQADAGVDAPAPSVVLSAVAIPLPTAAADAGAAE